MLLIDKFSDLKILIEARNGKSISTDGKRASKLV